MVKLTLKDICLEANNFANIESKHEEKKLYGITDGKAIGTYLEHKFKNYLKNNYTFKDGSSSKGIDFPELLRVLIK